MMHVKNEVVVPYSTEQMFILVNDISSYSDFIPGCIGSHILVHNAHTLIAKMDIFRLGINYSFVTKNFMVENQRIVIKLIYGPLKSLFGIWKFISLVDREISEVQCHFSCEFHSVVTEKVFSGIIEKVINDVIDSFVLRANEIYK